MKIAIVCKAIPDESVYDEFGNETIIIRSNESGAAILASPRSSTGRARAQEVLRQIIIQVKALTESVKQLESIRLLLEIDDCYSQEDAVELLLDAEKYLRVHLNSYEDDGIFCSYEFWMFSHSRTKWERLGA